MKKLLLGAAAALAIVTPGVAAADTSATVAFSYNSLDDDLDGFKEDYLGLDGSFATDVGGDWIMQFDGAVGDMNHSGHTDSFSTALIHLNHRTGTHSFGGFGGYSSANNTVWVIGAEGAFYLNRITLSGNVLYGFNREDDDSNITSAGVDASWFVTDSFSVGGDATWFENDFGSGFTQDGAIYGVNAEYQFAGSAFSIFGGYHVADYDNFGVDREVDSAQIGVRWNFGTANLIERNRSGAGLTGGDSLLFNQVATW